MARIILASLVMSVSSNASAQLVEPDGLSIPQPLSRDIEQASIDAFGTSPENMGLDALFEARGEDIDWQTDPVLEPATFSPMCGLSGQLVLRGGGCKVDFGWYNVNASNPAPPADAEIFPLITKEQLEGVGPHPAFWPRVGSDPVQGELLENIREDARYGGGAIAFAVRGNPDDVCTQSKYSERRLNQVCTACEPDEPWITAIIYQSTVTPNAFYIAFEDLPMSPESFEGFPDQEYFNDGDFNDFVYYVEGIACEGAGETCETDQQGACSVGLTECAPGGELICVPQLQPGDEVCDNIDNDCDGVVDDGDLCDGNEVCDRGVCKPECSGGEFPCPPSLSCDRDSGLCVTPECVGVECPAEAICLGGECVGGCAGAKCPLGQVCQLGRCVDPCAQRTGDAACPSGKVCENGACLEPCQCRTCGGGLECDSDSGVCVQDGCAGVACNEGFVCLAGECVDACTGVTCPGSGRCEAGVCGPPQTGSTGGAAGAAGTGTLEPPVSDPDGGSAGGTAGASGADGAGASAAIPRPEDPSCGCRVIGSDAHERCWPWHVTAWTLFAVLGLRLARRRQRCVA